MPAARATSEATAPGSSAAATIRSFSETAHRRRRCTDVITSTCVFMTCDSASYRQCGLHRTSPDAYLALTYGALVGILCSKRECSGSKPISDSTARDNLARDRVSQLTLEGQAMGHVYGKEFMDYA